MGIEEYEQIRFVFESEHKGIYFEVDDHVAFTMFNDELEAEIQVCLRSEEVERLIALLHS